MADRADRFMIGWQEWHYCPRADPTTTGPGAQQALVLDPAKPPRGGNVERAKLARLARPHPEAIAGTPNADPLRPRDPPLHAALHDAPPERARALRPARGHTDRSAEAPVSAQLPRPRPRRPRPRPAQRAHPAGQRPPPARDRARLAVA
jgi:hypothetical protein